MTKRTCPKCLLTELEPISENGLQLDRCPKCGGGWYDFGELENGEAKSPALLAALKKGLLKPVPGAFDCPSCGGTMQNGGLMSEFLRVDLCPACKGFWLDQAEERLLLKLISQPAA